MLWRGRRKVGPRRVALRLAVLFAGTSALLLTGTTAAQAASTGWSGPSGASGAGCHVNEADNLSNTWFDKNLTTTTRSAVVWTVGYIAGHSLMTEHEQSTSDSLTDVLYNDGAYATISGPPCVGNSSWYPKGNSIGYTVCWTTTSSGACQSHRVYIDTDWENNNSTSFIRALVLHESGHAIGLTHPNDGFGDVNVSGEIMSPTVPNIDNYTSRDLNLIDGELTN